MEEGEEEYNKKQACKLVIRPIYSKNVAVQMSPEYAGYNDFTQLSQLRSDFETQKTWASAVPYYHKLKHAYHLYDSLPESLRTKYTRTLSGHCYTWLIDEIREVSYPDLGFEYLACLVSLLVYIVQKATIASDLESLNRLINHGRQLVMELTQLSESVSKPRSLYMPTEFKYLTLSTLQATFMCFIPISKFFTILSQIQLPEEYDEAAFTEIAENHLNTLLSLYLGAYHIKAVALSGWNRVENSNFALNKLTPIIIKAKLEEAKSVITFISMFSPLIVKLDTKNKIQKLTQTMTKIANSNDPPPTYDKLPILSFWASEYMHCNNKKIGDIGRKLEIYGSGISECKSLGDYIIREKIEPVFEL